MPTRTKAYPLVPKNIGVADVTDIIEGIQKQLPPYLRNKVVPDLTDGEFEKLPRDPKGYLIGLQSKSIFNRFSDEQLKSLPQHDKDQIRDALGLDIVRGK